jgi:hypothetical protein
MKSDAIKTAEARKELENTLVDHPELEYTEQDGALIKKVTQVDIYSALRRLNKTSAIQSKFLLYLDDRMHEYNGFRAEVIQLQGDVNQYLNNRTESCPVLPLVRKVEEMIGDHLDDEEKEKLITTTTESLREKWMDQGREEQQQRFERISKIIGLLLTGITVATATITWIFGIWPR